MITNRALRDLTAYFSAIYLGVFLTGLISFVGVQFYPAPIGLSVSIYLIYGAGLLLSMLVFLKRQDLRKTIFKTLTVAIVMLLPLFANGLELGGVEKSYIVGIGSILVFSTIAASSGRREIGFFSASLVFVICLFCLFDVYFYDGLTHTRGRAAGLFANPNIAAIVILFSAVGTVWAVPARMRIAFLVVSFAAVFATLSRTAILLSFITFIASVPLIARNWRSHLVGLIPGILSALLVSLFLAGAFANNKSFGVAIESSFRGLILADSIWAKANSSFNKPPQIVTKNPPLAESSDIRQVIAWSESATHQISNQLLRDVERENSAAARVVLLQRAMIEYRNGSVFGSGLERAFELGPHNSFVLFAVAFGHLGWLIVPLFALFILFTSDWRHGLPSAVLLLGAAFFSHDVFTSIPIVASLVVVLSGLILQKEKEDEDVHELKDRSVVAAVLTLASLGLTSLFFVLSHYPKSWSADIRLKEISHQGGNSYYAALNAPPLSGIVRLTGESGPNSGITENGQFLAKCISSPDDVAGSGRGRCQFENLGVLFSASDNTSPLLNARKYRFSSQLSIHPLYVLMIVVLITWTAFFILSVYRRRFAEEH